MAITAFISRSLGLLNRGPRGPASLGHVPHSSIFSPTDLNSNWSIFLSPGLYNNLISTYFLRASQFRTQFNPSTVKVISWYSSTGCTRHLHRCISYFDSLAGSKANIQHFVLLIIGLIQGFSPPSWLGNTKNSMKIWTSSLEDHKKKQSVVLNKLCRDNNLLPKYAIYICIYIYTHACVSLCVFACMYVCVTYCYITVTSSAMTNSSTCLKRSQILR